MFIQGFLVSVSHSGLPQNGLDLVSCNDDLQNKCETMPFEVSTQIDCEWKQLPAYECYIDS